MRAVQRTAPAQQTHRVAEDGFGFDHPARARRRAFGQVADGRPDQYGPLPGKDIDGTLDRRVLVHVVVHGRCQEEWSGARHQHGS